VLVSSVLTVVLLGKQNSSDTFFSTHQAASSMLWNLRSPIGNAFSAPERLGATPFVDHTGHVALTYRASFNTTKSRGFGKLG
jgi:hypothetical protein